MILDFIYTIFFLIIAYGFPILLLSKKELEHKNSLNKLMLFHFFVSVAFYFFTRNGGGDAWTYWVEAKNMTSNEFYLYLLKEKGTYFIYAVNYILANILGMSFFANTMFYAMLGYMGIVYFYLIALRNIPYNTKFKGYKLFPLLLFLPNLHFWSSGVGKDTILFFCIGAFAYGMQNIVKRMPLLIFSLLLSYLVRPHIALFLLISFSLAYLFDAKTSAIKRFFLVIIFLGAIIAILPTVMKFANVDSTSITSINKKLADQADLLNQGSGSGVDISNYPFPLKVLTFLFRPFFFDINGIPAIVASFENLLLLVLAYKAFTIKLIDTFKNAPFVIKGLLILLIVGTLVFAQSLGNVGIMIRMRNMLLPGFIIYLLWAFSYQQQIKTKLKGVKDLQKET